MMMMQGGVVPVMQRTYICAMVHEGWKIPADAPVSRNGSSVGPTVDITDMYEKFQREQLR